MRLTPLGRGAVAVAVACWLAALLSGSLAAGAAGAMATIALAQALLAMRAPRVAVERSVPRESYREGEVVEERLVLRAQSRLRARVLAEETATDGLDPETPGGFEAVLSGSQERTLRWKASTWGRKTLGPLRLTVRDPLSLLETRVLAEGQVALRVHPAGAPLGKYKPRASNPEPALGAHNVSKPGDGSEFFALRDYQQGDSIRRINWKASVRAGKTIVNQVTRDSFARVLVLLDMREKETLGSAATCALVRSGRAVASILNHHDRMRDHLTILALSDGPRRLTVSPNPRLTELLDALAAAPRGGECDLEEALRANLRFVKPRSPVYLVTSGVLDERIRSTLLVLQAMQARPVMICPGLPPPEDVGAQTHAVLERSREDAMAAARSAGVPVADWRDGSSLEVLLAVS